MWQLDPARTALLVIDMQNDFVRDGHPMLVPEAQNRVAAMQHLVDGCRDVGVPVIYTRHILLDSFNVSPLECAYNPRLLHEGMRQGSRGAEIISELEPLPHDVVIDKHRYDAFHNTRLETVLRTVRGLHGVDTVIIAGTVTEVCCETTARSAYSRDYKVAFASDATAALSPRAQEATEANISSFFGRVLTAADILTELSSHLASRP